MRLIRMMLVFALCLASSGAPSAPSPQTEYWSGYVYLPGAVPDQDDSIGYMRVIGGDRCYGSLYLWADRRGDAIDMRRVGKLWNGSWRTFRDPRAYWPASGVRLEWGGYHVWSLDIAGTTCWARLTGDR